MASRGLNEGGVSGICLGERSLGCGVVPGKPRGLAAGSFGCGVVPGKPPRRAEFSLSQEMGMSVCSLGCGVVPAEPAKLDGDAVDFGIVPSTNIVLGAYFDVDPAKAGEPPTGAVTETSGDVCNALSLGG